MTDQDQTFSMPSNPEDRKKIKEALNEMCGALQFIDDKRQFMKDVAETLHEKYEMPKKLVMKMARTLHKHNYDDVSHESEVFSIMFETLFQDSAGDNE